MNEHEWKRPWAWCAVFSHRSQSTNPKVRGKKTLCMSLSSICSTAVAKAPLCNDLASIASQLSAPPPSPSPAPPKTSASSLPIPSTFLPQGLCTCSSHSLLHNIQVVSFFTILQVICRYHLHKEVFQDPYLQPSLTPCLGLFFSIVLRNTTDILYIYLFFSL